MHGSLMDQIKSMSRRIQILEDRARETHRVIKRTVLTEKNKRKKYAPQQNMYFGMYLALCVSTEDPLKQNRVRFYSPLLNDPPGPDGSGGTQVEQLDWAWPISPMGGFDDCGLNWVPPAGSLLCIIFERGGRSSPFYLGTTWTRDRGAGTVQENSEEDVGQYNFGFPVTEFMKVSHGHRKGYLFGPNNGSEVLPPWNTESMNGTDVNAKEGISDEDAIPSANVTYPNIYGFKTPEKLLLKMVDGNAKCNHRWKRIELMSNFNWMLMKDDFLHPGGQWAHPDCGCGGGDVSKCVNRATVGVYYWNKGSDYVKYAEQMIAKNIRVNNEFYVCPVYNEAIQDGKKFIEYFINKMWGLGTPEDLKYFLENT